MKKLEELFSIDLRSLALFRIALGCLLLAELFVRAAYLEAHYTDLGVLPRGLIYEKSSLMRFFYVHFLTGRFDYQAILFIAQTFFAFALLLGYYTRLATVACWYLLASLQKRNLLVLQGGDILLLLLLFWAMFLPLGKRLSLDSLRAQEIPPERVFSGGSAALLLQVAFVYWFSVIFKWNPDWLQGNAVYYALQLDHFATPLGIWMRQFPYLLVVLSYATFFLEFFCPTLAFSPIATARCRMIAVILAMGMHFGFSLGLELGLFAYTSMASWLVFIPTAFWQKEEVLKPALKGAFYANAAALLLIAYVFFWNLYTLGFKSVNERYPSDFSWVGRALQLKQSWNMFYIPTKETGWFVIAAELLNGKLVDLYRGGAPLEWKKPPLVSLTYRDQRWRKYLENLISPSGQKYLPYYARYLCVEWNRHHPGEEEIKSLQIVYMKHYIFPNNQVSDTIKTVLWNESCQH